MQYGVAFAPLVPVLILWIALGAIVVVFPEALLKGSPIHVMPLLEAYKA